MEPLSDARPLTARSVVASTLLGVHPPELPGQVLVRFAELFGIHEGTTRTALSRMVAAGELVHDAGRYGLAGRLLERQARQDATRRPAAARWDGGWTVAVVVGERREAAARARLREAMRRLKLAELREGVWLRPDNLDPDRSPADAEVVDQQCARFAARPDGDPAELAGELWDLAGWAGAAAELASQLREMVPALQLGDTTVLADAFVLQATALRHLLADPMLPGELLPDSWPGAELRADYDRAESAFKELFRSWFRSRPSPT